ncbi:MAG: SDR family oxidoreductase [Verrucomicrobiota bacterium]|nr:SDR family oxidoreductase [Verrucomicrobiota bacterium]
MDLQLKDKKVVITGGAKGIGAAIVRSFAAESAVPIIVGRNPEEAEALISETGTGHSYHVELTDLNEIQITANKISDEIGPIDILINNAGVNDGASIEDGPSTFIHSLEKNLIHPFALVHHFLNDLKSTQGNIVNVGSKVAVTGQGGTSGYAASKGGINALTREWALDLAQYGIRVNCVVPAEVMTPLYENWLAKNPDPIKAKEEIESTIPLGQRFTESEEIADMVVFLASLKSAHTTGQIIYPDGGYTHLDRAYDGKKSKSE